MEIGFQAVGGLTVIGAAGSPEFRDELGQILGAERCFTEDRCLHGFQRRSGLDAERAAQLGERMTERAGIRDPAVEGRPVLQQFADGVLITAIAGGEDHGSERLSERAGEIGGRRAENLPARIGDEDGRGVLFEHLKMSGNAGLEGKLMQQPFAEGVDCLDLEAARCLQRQREQATGARAHRGRGLPPVQILQVRVEFGMVHTDPFRQPVEDADRHLRGGGLGEGETEKACWIGAREQQAHHALRQHMRLAGAGIRRHPGRASRRRSFGLPLLRHTIDGARDRVHGSGRAA